MAAVFATMMANDDDAQHEGHWRRYVGLVLHRHTAPFGRLNDLAATTVPTVILTGDSDACCSVETACVADRTIDADEPGIVLNTGHKVTAAVVDAMTSFLMRQAAGAWASADGAAGAGHAGSPTMVARSAGLMPRTLFAVPS